MEDLPDTSPDVFTEALALARYLLPKARPLLGPGARLSARVAGDYARALRRHRRPTLRQALRGGRPLNAATLWAWEGALAPPAQRSRVRQHLLLMSAILESQPELAPHFLPRNVTRAQAVWALFRVALATAAAGALSLRLVAGRRTSHAP